MPASQENAYRVVIMTLIVGLFLVFGVGFLVGADSSRDTHVIDTSPYPRNYDVTKANAELLQKCYDYANNQTVNMLSSMADTRKALAEVKEQGAKQEAALQAAEHEGKFLQQTVVSLSRTCDKKVTH